MKFFLIGNGFISQKHKESIQKIKGEIVGIADDGKGEDEWRHKIEKTDADCIVVLAPNDLHFEMSKRAAELGKTVLCEKPLAINSEHAKKLTAFPNIFTVLQLRHHPDVLKIKEEMKKDGKNNIEMDISVYRDDQYYNSWKGKKERSGGVLFNLGSHYFDLLLHIFGDAEKAFITKLDDKTGEGVVEGDNYICNFKISTGEEKNNQRRIFKVNGRPYNFSSKDNLSYENLHEFVYMDLIQGKGVKPDEALKSIELIEKLYNSYEK